MNAWAWAAVAEVAIVAVSIWRLSRVDRAIWWPGVVTFVVAALAILVMAADDGYWLAIAIFGMIVLATDVLLLQGALVTSLCTRARAPEDPAA